MATPADEASESPKDESEANGAPQASEEESSEFTASEEEDESSWISWFINLRGNEFFCAIDEEFIQDDFNLTGLSAMVRRSNCLLDIVFIYSEKCQH